MHCSKCGAGQPEGTLFCSNCGTPVTPIVSKIEKPATKPHVGWLIGTILSALVSLFFCPVVFGAFGFFSAWMVKRNGKEVLGVLFMVINVMTTILGMLFGFIVGLQGTGNFI